MLHQPINIDHNVLLNIDNEKTYILSDNNDNMISLEVKHIRVRSTGSGLESNEWDCHWVVPYKDETAI